MGIQPGMIYISVDTEQLYQLLMSSEFEQVCTLAFVYVLSSKVLWLVPYILLAFHVDSYLFCGYSHLIPCQNVCKLTIIRSVAFEFIWHVCLI